MADVRTETRELISTMSAGATTVSSSVNQKVFVNCPSIEWALDARQELDTAIGGRTAPTGLQDEIREYLDGSSSLSSLALARLRMDIESELRRILGEPPPAIDAVGMRGRVVAARPMFRKLASLVPKYQKLRSSFDYVLEVCNAVIHGQTISENATIETKGMGLQILCELKSEAKRDSQTNG